MGSLVGSKVFERQIKTLVDSNDPVLSVERKSSVRCNRILAYGIVKGFLAEATANIIELCFDNFVFSRCKLLEVDSQWGGQKQILLGTRTQSLTFEFCLSCGKTSLINLESIGLH